MAIVRRALKSGRVSWWVVVRHAGKALWRRAASQAEARVKEREWKAAIADGTFAPDVALSSSPTLAEYLPVWLGKRTNRTASHDRSMMRDHVLRYDIARLKLSEVRPRHAMRLVEQLRAAELSDKTVSNVLGTLRVLFRDALIAELVYSQPIVLPKRTLKRRRAEEPGIYQPSECRALMLNQATDPRARVLWALALFTGVRQGELVGRQWGDFRVAMQLNAMLVRSQYDGQPLKTDNHRIVPLHPVLQRVLEDWSGAWEMLVGRKPQPDDFVVPDLRLRASGCGLTKNQSYKMLRASAESAGVKWRGVHATRHTFITLARRGGANERALEKITHNARGGIVDGYTRQDWAPLCDVVLCLSFDSDQRIGLPGQNPAENPLLFTSAEAVFSPNR